MHQSSLRSLACVFAGLIPLVWPGPQSLVQAGSSPSQSPDNSEVVERWLRGVGVALKELPRDRFDLVSVARGLNGNPSSVAAWVRENTDWIPYEGILRGPRGVLMDRLGNDWDRALLLASLLELKGVRVRLMRAPWTEQGLERVGPALDLATGCLPEASSSQNLEAFANRARLPLKALEAGIRKAKWQAERNAQEVRGQVERLFNELMEVLPEPTLERAVGGVTLPQPGEDHVWVQFERDGKWIDLDPCLSTGEGLPASAGSDTSSPLSGGTPLELTALDASLYHRVSLSVTSEEWSGSKRLEHELLSKEWRTMDLVGESLVFVMPSLDLNFQMEAFLGMQDWQAEFLKQTGMATEWIPSIQALGQVHSSQSVRPDGTPNKSPVRTAEGQAAENAADRLSNLGKPKAAKGTRAGLTALWLDWKRSAPPQNGVVERPGGQAVRAPLVETTTRRTLFDLVGAHARAEGGDCPEVTPAAIADRDLILTGSTSIVVMPCDVPGQFTQYLSGNQLWGAKDMLLQAASSPVGPNSGSTTSNKTSLDFPTLLPSELWGLSWARQAWNENRGTYVDRVNVFSHHSTFRLGEDGSIRLQSGMDLVWNDRASFAEGMQGYRAKLRQGILDSVGEYKMIENASQGQGQTSVWSSNPAACESGWRLVDTADSMPEGWPIDAMIRMNRELQLGYVLIVPREADSGFAPWQFGYWRVNPNTGLCLTMGGQGWGAAVVQEASERVIAVAAIINVSRHMVSFVACAHGAGDREAGLCFVKFICQMVVTMGGIASASPIITAMGSGICSAL